ncbi:MAG: GtrA family protein [Natrialbaceae archaeon]|nr:GtrA family protein [Natrialbaceae archaeon]
MLVELAGVGLVLGKVASWVSGIAVIFTLNEYWTFSEYGDGSQTARIERLGRSFVVRFGGFCVAMGVLLVLSQGLGVWFVLANVIGIGSGFFVNYTFETLFTWRVQHDERR